MGDSIPVDKTSMNFSSLEDVIKFARKGKHRSEREKAIIEIYNAIKGKNDGIVIVNGKSLRLIPPEIKFFSTITELSFEDNKITDVCPELGYMTNLKKISLRGNQISSLPEEICNLRNLEDLDLSENELEYLPAKIGELQKLKRFDISKNKIRQLPISMENLPSLDSLSMHNNNIPVPPEILAQTPKTIIGYAIQITSESTRAINEAKVLLVGQGGVGKTSLVKRLTSGEFDEYEQKTDGILIKNWHIPVDNSWLRLNVWDFGGQEIMHATHQFFLTERSLYILVWDARQEDTYGQIDYWLNIVQSFGNDAPVIVVLNKIDVGTSEIDRRGLKRKFSNIRGFVNISCKNEAGIEELREMILAEITRMPHVRTSWIAKWFAVKSKLEEMNRDYISIIEFQEVCSNAGLETPEEVDNLLKFLHDLGVILSFQNDPRLNDTNVLNPEWVTNGVYKILNANDLAQEGGVLIVDRLSQLLDNIRYPREKHGFILSLMKKFELCYELDDANQLSFLVTDLLSKQQPFFKWDYKYSLAFQYHYNFLPSSVISRFIVRMHQFIDKNLVWRSGVILHNEKNRAVVIADRSEKKVFIYVDGLRTTRRDFLAIIRSNFEYIHKSISKIETQEKVPLPDDQRVLVDYSHLLTLLKLGERTFIPEGWKKPVEVSQLLFGIESGEYREKRKQQESANSTWIHEQNNLTINNIQMEANMSYADNSQKITAGRDVNISESQVMLKDVSGKLQNSITSISNEQSEIKQLLEELKDLIESDSRLPDTEKIEGMHHLETLIQIAKGLVDGSKEKIETAIRILKGIFVEGTAELYESGMSIVVKLKDLLINLLPHTH